MNRKQINNFQSPEGWFVLFFVICLIYPGLAQAQYTIRQSTFGNGAGITSVQGNRIRGTLGQPFIGVMSNSTNREYSGFWYTPRLVITDISDEPENTLPTEYRLYQNYPNPFNPTTTIRFTIPERNHVSLKIYDLLGREVATLVDGKLNPGRYSYIFDARGLASGIYFAQLRAGKYVKNIKMIILK
ncbi:MAG: T9SS C-terminal target domain-containing protein [Methanobacteriota archaeon]|nr:MAG: T9SS C-terminal target domain-containing protein [Euryarchaeota archaeon]